MSPSRLTSCFFAERPASRWRTVSRRWTLKLNSAPCAELWRLTSSTWVNPCTPDLNWGASSTPSLAPCTLRWRCSRRGVPRTVRVAAFPFRRGVSNRPYSVCLSRAPLSQLPILSLRSHQALGAIMALVAAGAQGASAPLTSQTCACTEVCDRTWTHATRTPHCAGQDVQGTS